MALILHSYCNPLCSWFPAMDFISQSLTSQGADGEWARFIHMASTSFPELPWGENLAQKICAGCRLREIHGGRVKMQRWIAGKYRDSSGFSFPSVKAVLGSITFPFGGWHKSWLFLYFPAWKCKFTMCSPKSELPFLVQSQRFAICPCSIISTAL